MPINTEVPGVYQTTFPLRYPDADAAGFLRLTSLLNLLQIQAGDHTQSLGFDYCTNKDAGIFWVLTRLTVCVDEWPEYPCELSVETWARSTRAVFALRDFRFGSDQSCSGRASSAWVLLKDHKPQRPEPWVAIYQPVRLEEPVAEMPAALPAFDKTAVDSAPTLGADWEDVDMNGHVNNVNAVGWCLVQHDFDFLKEWRPHFLEANFLAEMFCGQKFVVRHRELASSEGTRTFDYLVERETDQTPTLRLRIAFRRETQRD